MFHILHITVPNLELKASYSKGHVNTILKYKQIAFVAFHTFKLSFINTMHIPSAKYTVYVSEELRKMAKKGCKEDRSSYQFYLFKQLY
jgi:hypothetical protein